MRTLCNIFGSVLIVLGILSASGAAGDCDGACMENANSIGFMIIIMFGSICSIILGAVFLRLARMY
tara:strand:- start:4104 stop:4301 length:198 start_codon:yes stop_codon:yes gene_type:complete